MRAVADTLEEMNKAGSNTNGLAAWLEQHPYGFRFPAERRVALIRFVDSRLTPLALRREERGWFALRRWLRQRPA